MNHTEDFERKSRAEERENIRLKIQTLEDRIKSQEQAGRVLKEEIEQLKAHTVDLENENSQIAGSNRELVTTNKNLSDSVKELSKTNRELSEKR